MPSVKQVKGGYQARVQVRGMGQKRKTFPTRALAERWASQTHVRLLEGKHFPKSDRMLFTELVVEYYEKDACHRLKANTFNNVKICLNYWNSLFGPRMLSRIRLSDIKQGRDDIPNVTNATKNRYMAALSGMFRYAVECEYMESNPCQKFRKLPTDGKRGRVLTYDEEQLLLEHAQGPIKQFIQFALATGARLSEIEKLNIFDVVPGSPAKCTFTKTKNKTDRIIGLNGDAHRAIKDVRIVGVNNLFGDFPRRSWIKLLDECSIENLRFHDLRHTFISRAIARGVPQEVVAKYVGHKTLAITSHYTHLTSATTYDIVFGSTTQERRINE